jgi:hypothetical protein
MKQVTFPVPRPLAWYVQQHVPLEDTEQFWRICYYFDQLHNADRIYRIISLLLFLSVLVVLPLIGMPWLLSIPFVVFAMQVAVRENRRFCYKRLQDAIGADEKKWQMLGGPAVEIEQEYEFGDPTVPITITVPDE